MYHVRVRVRRLFGAILGLFILFALGALDGALVHRALALLVFRLVLDQIVKRDDGTNQRAEIDDEHGVVARDVEAAHILLQIQVWQQIERLWNESKRAKW